MMKDYNPKAWKKETSSGETQGEKMKKQRNTAQMKEEGRNSQDRINEEERNNLTERESK